MREMPLRRKATSRSTAPLSLAARLGLLSSRRQEIIRPAFEHPRGFVLLSVRALAKRLKTDPATMIRIVRGMQFRSYREFQHYLHELSIAHATSLDTMQTGGAGKHTVPAQARASLDQDAKNLDAVIQNLDSRRVAALTRRFYSAKKVILWACCSYCRSGTLTLLIVVGYEQDDGFSWYESRGMRVANLAPFAVGWVIR